MPFDESHSTAPQTAQDAAIDAEKRRRTREYQRLFVQLIVHCLHCQRDLTPEELRSPLYREMGRLCGVCRTELEQYLEPEEDDL